MEPQVRTLNLKTESGVRLSAGLLSPVVLRDEVKHHLDWADVVVFDLKRFYASQGWPLEGRHVVLIGECPNDYECDNFASFTFVTSEDDDEIEKYIDCDFDRVIYKENNKPMVESIAELGFKKILVVGTEQTENMFEKHTKIDLVLMVKHLFAVQTSIDGVPQSLGC